MEIRPGDASEKYLDPNFFAHESKQLHLTPELERQFKMIVQELVGQFERDVNATSEGFISFLQQSTHMSPKSIMQALNKKQGAIEGTTQDFLDHLKSRLLETAGPNYSNVVNQFIEDIHKQLTQFINLEARVRSVPELNKKLSP